MFLGWREEKALCAAALVIAAAIIAVKKASQGYFEERPEAEYLAAEKAAVRPYYEQLSDTEKAVYTAMYQGISAHKEEIIFPVGIDMETYDKLYTLMLDQESEFFYMSYTYSVRPYMYKAEISYSVDDAEECEEMAHELESAAGQALSGVPKGADDFEKACWIHDYIIRNCTYAGTETNQESTAYGCLVEGKARCGGYSRAFDYLAKQLGMQSVLITGKTKDGELHAWNQVKIDGDWCNVDVTWDDSEDSGATYANFLCTDEGFNKNHIADSAEFSGFPCTAKEKSYYVSQDLQICSLDDAERILRREISGGAARLEVQMTNDSIYEEFKRKYLTDEQKTFEILEGSGRDPDRILLIENPEERIMVLEFIN